MVLFLALACHGKKDPVDETGPDDTGPTAPVPALTLEFDGEPPKNLVLLHTDTLRTDHLSLYDSPHDTLPTLLAAYPKESWFISTNHRSVSNWTGPATASLMSSVDIERHRAASAADRTKFHSKDAQVPDANLQQFLSDHGYATALWSGNIWLTEEVGFQKGFDTTTIDLTEPGNGRAMVGQAMDWVSQVDGPFFLHVQMIDTHDPWYPIDEFQQTFSDYTQFPFEVGAESQQQLKAGFRMDELEGDPAAQEAFADEVRGLYDEEVLGIDEAARLVMDLLAQSGHLDDTLVVFTADHGEALGEFQEEGEKPSWQFGHGRASLRHELTSLALAFYNPHLRGGTTDCLTSNLDMWPTLAALLGLGELPDGLDGVDATVACRPVSVSTRYHYNSDREELDRLMATDGKLAVHASCVDDWWLAYDLTLDPDETNPLDPAALEGADVFVQAIEDKLDTIRNLWPDSMEDCRLE